MSPGSGRAALAPRLRGRGSLLGLLALALAAWLVPTARAQDSLPLRAAIAVNLLQFVQWPDDTLQAASPLVLCADRAGGLWPHLQALQSRPVHGSRLLDVRELPASAEGLRGCHAWLAEPTPASRRLPAAAAAGRPQLVIGDLERAGEPGVVIGLQLSGDRVAFSVDLGAARRGGLQVSSKLLRLATQVRE